MNVMKTFNELQNCMKSGSILKYPKKSSRYGPNTQKKTIIVPTKIPSPKNDIKTRMCFSIQYCIKNRPWIRRLFLAFTLVLPCKS